jgi:hypothetical protein
MNKETTIRFVTATLLILAAAMTRLLPHAPNATPILGIAIFGAAVLYHKTWMKYVIPLSAMLITDLFLGFGSIQLFTYGSIGLIIAGSSMLLKKRTFARVLAGSLMAAVVFFLVTNFGSWLMFDMYERTLSGLATCYTMAIPFFRNTLASTLVSTGALFGLYYLVEKVFIKPVTE